ncbi:MAG: sulfatase-like hydrolase/transferase [Bacteroidota bacterium]
MNTIKRKICQARNDLRVIPLSLFLLAIVSCKDNRSTDKESNNVESRLPNIVLLVGDDQGYPYFGFMGADYIQTPNMDSLARNGFVFTNGYVPENHCRPSLQTLMTGTLPIEYARKRDSIMKMKMEGEKFQLLSPEEQKKWRENFDFHAMQYFTTLPRILKEKGYTSFQGGKWWEFNFQNGGFDVGMTKGWKEAERKNPDWFQKFMGGEGTNLARVTMQPVYDFIEANGENPFFIWYAPELPHYPFDAPGKYYDSYRHQDMSESAKRYYANCTWFDDGVGELKGFLKEKNLYDDTLFVYVNDNGWEQNPKQEFRNDSLRWHNGGDKGKLSIFDQSFRTPIVFSWDSKIEKGKISDKLIHSADIPATILDYLSIEIPNDFYGTSFKQVIEGEDVEFRNEIIGNVNQIRSEEDMMGRSIEGYWLRNKDWFFKWNVTDAEVGLFNMQDDPFNHDDLSYENSEMVEDLKQKIMIWKEGKNPLKTKDL